MQRSKNQMSHSNSRLSRCELFEHHNWATWIFFRLAYLS